jgi:hypothetical protein
VRRRQVTETVEPVEFKKDDLVRVGWKPGVYSLSGYMTEDEVTVRPYPLTPLNVFEAQQWVKKADCVKVTMLPAPDTDS